MRNTADDEKYISRCIELAKMGLGSTSPNPMVGSVIVHNKRIIGEGYHYRAGGPHAEAIAIRSVKDKSVLNNSTLYVNLEPCAHTGRTPPCSDLIIQHAIPRIVIGTIDPNSLVSGKGIKRLKAAGRTVKTGILEKECRLLNKRFFTFHEKKRPYIILKWAQTADGFIDVIRDKNSPIGINWISNEISRMLVHKWRSEEDAIMVGTNTAEIDNPMLSTREWYGKSPLRVVLDKNLRLPGHSRLYDKSLPTIVFTEKDAAPEKNLLYRKISFGENFFSEMLTSLCDIEKQSLIIEGGRQLINSFINRDLWDEARIFEGTKTFNQGIMAPVIPGKADEIQYIGEDRLIICHNS